MLEKMLNKPVPEKTRAANAFARVYAREGWPISGGSVYFLMCGLLFLLCIFLTMMPLIRLPDPVIRLRIPLGSWLAQAGNWLPVHLGLAGNQIDDQGSTAYVEFFLLISLAFLLYLFAAWLIKRFTEPGEQHVIRGIIWAVALLTGTIYLVTPAMLSHDILAYASYGRILVLYHANPYFVPIAAFPGDPYVSLNYWASVVSAYGPIWMLICGFWAFFSGPDPVTYVLIFRLFALVVQLLSIWLIGRTLRAMGRSPRTVTQGMLIYAWNPLVILESSLGGHNDVLMVAFILGAALLAARAEMRGRLLTPGGYLPPVAALSLAALVKFTALPILAAYLIFLFCKTVRSTWVKQSPPRWQEQRWRPGLLTLAWSLLVAAMVALAFYGPFWLGHTLSSIIASFKDQPSALYSENSLMRATGDFLLFHPADRQNIWLFILGNRRYWDNLNYALIALLLAVGGRQLWKQPSIKTGMLVALATLDAVLLITPWFFTWYVLWVLSLAAICLPARARRIEAALLAFTLTLSFSALLTYLFKDGYPPFGIWTYVGSAVTAIPPACAFLLTLILWRPEGNQTKGKARQ